jgi:hypothetical protein
VESVALCGTRTLDNSPPERIVVPVSRGSHAHLLHSPAFWVLAIIAFRVGFFVFRDAIQTFQFLRRAQSPRCRRALSRRKSAPPDLTSASSQ